ncbi:MAG TPA: DUF3500 domain-containing protein [Candidatus Polarisedimenticolaceae bacterium]
MRSTVFPIFLAVLFVAASARAADPPASPAMAAAAKAFLASLDPGKRAKANLPFNSDERLNWHFIPRERQGVSFKEMTPGERETAGALLKSSLSAVGYDKAETIRRLEEVLFAQSKNPVRDTELFFFTVFGEPSPKGAWGWRYEGHHLSFNWTVVDGKLAASTPQFFGANPADVREGPQKGTRALAAEEDLGRALVKSLRPEQLAQALVGEASPGEILTEASRIASIQKDEGIPYGKLDAEQQGLVLSLIREYAASQAPAEAQTRLTRVKGDLANLKFAWMGGLEKGQGHYYRIQGSTDLIEYDNTQNGANHIHCVWRAFRGDWGRDLLEEHYKTAPHHSPSGGAR